MAAPWATTASPTLSKLDDLITGLGEVKETLTKLCDFNKQFQQFMTDKNDHDLMVRNDIEHIRSTGRKLESDLVQMNAKSLTQDTILKRQEQLINQVILPIFDDILSFLLPMMKDTKGRPLDADMKCRFDRYRAQVMNAKQGKQFA